MVNTIAQLDEEVLETAEENNESVSAFLSNFEELLLSVDVTEETPLTVKEESVTVQVNKKYVYSASSLIHRVSNTNVIEN